MFSLIFGGAHQIGPSSSCSPSSRRARLAPPPAPLAQSHPSSTVTTPISPPTKPLQKEHLHHYDIDATATTVALAVEVGPKS